MMMTYQTQSTVCLREDMVALLSALSVLARITMEGRNSPHDAAFRRGFAAALYAVATALHIPPAQIRDGGWMD